jgi:dihydrofolate reductase
MPKIEAILAIDEKNGISKNGKIPWKNKTDMLFFKNKTINNIVIMGSKTLLSLPNSQPLKDRDNIILTNNKNKYNKYSIFDNITFFNYNELIDYLNNINTDKIIYIIGGKEIYNLLIPYCDKIWLSIINGNYDCDLQINLDFNNCLYDCHYLDSSMGIFCLTNKK